MFRMAILASAAAVSAVTASTAATAQAAPAAAEAKVDGKAVVADVRKILAANYVLPETRSKLDAAQAKGLGAGGDQRDLRLAEHLARPRLGHRLDVTAKPDAIGALAPLEGFP